MSPGEDRRTGGERDSDLTGPVRDTAAQGADGLTGGGLMGELTRAFDWSRTPLGPATAWPQSLRTVVSLALASRFPMLVVWGRDYTQLYNDAFRPILGALKHPAALGQGAAECWHEIWDTFLEPLFSQVISGGDSVWNEDLALSLDRNGYLEETFFTFSYSAIRDESGQPGGILVTCVETTDRIVGERRLTTLSGLAAAGSGSRSVAVACQTSAAALGGNPHDVPFALVYLFEDGGARARLAAAIGITPGDAAAPEVLALDAERSAVWPIAPPDTGSGQPRQVDLASRAGTFPGGPWPEPAARAALVPIAHAGAGEALGTLVVGLSPRRPFDAGYERFVQLVAAQLATAVTNARTYEAERERAEALAQIDRAKTAFFSNVSHEFRTPLTLILGPVQALLEESAGPLTSAQREQLAALSRNAARLLRLVNALLDFSRIEAGRMRAVYRPTDLSRVTREVAASFSSLMEQGGLKFDVACDPLTEPVYVDQDMWEKVVLNLLSNAFKFTFTGGVRVSLTVRDSHVELVVSDTGVGIPEGEIARIFERFHRVEAQRSRSHEGSGIGLALTHDLVALHGGSIAVESREGEGSAFVVRIPTGRAHLPADRVHEAVPVAGGAQAPAFVEEASRWFAAPSAWPADRPKAPEDDDTPAARILVVDDNEDMRNYLVQLLAGWEVDTAADGSAALARVRQARPDLIVTDVMMPGLGGFDLLAALRKDPPTADIPVLMLSARAGEEARVSGLDAGADDYIVKPFGGREFVARVRSLLALSRARVEAEAANRTKDEFLAMLGHELRNPLAPILTALQLMRMRGEDSAVRERQVIERQVRHLVRLVDDLLDVSGIARGKVELRRSRVDLSEIITASVENTGPMMTDREHRLELRLRDEPLLVDGDGIRLAQVVTNLLTNACKYTPPGGRIIVSAGRDGATVELRVSDTGIGIPAELLPRVFDLFTQGRQQRHRPEGGLGLGLSIVRSLVRLHGGTIEARSDGPGSGSEFIVRLPALSPPA